MQLSSERKQWARFPWERRAPARLHTATLERGVPRHTPGRNRKLNAPGSQDIACTKNDLYAFLEYLIDAFLVYTVPTQARSEHVRRVN